MYISNDMFRNTHPSVVHLCVYACMFDFISTKPERTKQQRLHWWISIRESVPLHISNWIWNGLYMFIYIEWNQHKFVLFGKEKSIRWTWMKKIQKVLHYIFSACVYLQTEQGLQTVSVISHAIFISVDQITLRKYVIVDTFSATTQPTNFTFDSNCLSLFTWIVLKNPSFFFPALPVCVYSIFNIVIA